MTSEFQIIIKGMLFTIFFYVFRENGLAGLTSQESDKTIHKVIV